MFEGMATRDKDPRKSIHIDDVPLPELGPGEAYVAVMASAINYNTVWTSIFEPVSTFGFLKRYGKSHPLATRHDLPYHIIGSDVSGVVLRTGPGVNAWQPGDEVVAHCLSVELESPARAQRHDARPRTADLGLRDQLRRPGADRAGEVQPVAAQAQAPDLGGGCSARPGELHRVPAARVPQRRRHEAGRHRADLGRFRRSRLLRHPVRPQRRGDPRLRRLQRGEGRDRSLHGRRTGHQPRRRGLPVLEGRVHPGPQGMAAVRQEDPRAHRRRGRRHRLRAPRPGDVRRLGVRRPARAAPSPPAPRPAATCTSTTTATCG